MDELKWELLTEVQGRSEADVLKAFLIGNGIEDVELFQESLGQHIYPTTLDLLGNVQLWVPKGQLKEVRKLFDFAQRELGHIDILINAAGVNIKTRKMSEMSPEQWDYVISANATGAYNCMREVLPAMQERRDGVIVNISSIAGVIVRTAQISYCAAKAAVIHFSRCLAVDMAPHGITVNCLCPGMTWTAMLETSAKERGLDLEAMVALIPAGKMADPADHAYLVAYFASEEAKHVTGQVVCVDGGQSQFMPLMATRL